MAIKMGTLQHLHGRFAFQLTINYRPLRWIEAWSVPPMPASDGSQLRITARLNNADPRVRSAAAVRDDFRQLPQGSGTPHARIQCNVHRDTHLTAEL